MRKLTLPRHLLVALTNWIARLISMGLQLITVPLLTRTLGYNDYAAYAVTISLMSWFALVDMGIGGTLQNLVGKARMESKDVGSELAAGFTVLFTMLVIGSLAWLALSPWIARLLFAEMPLTDESAKTSIIALAGVCFLANGVGVVGTKVLYATRRGVLANVLTAGTSLLSFGALWIGLHHGSGSGLLIVAVACYVVPLGFTGAAVSLWALGSSASFEVNKLKSALGALVRPSSVFWLYALLGAAVHSVDYIIMSRTLQPDEISKYNILYRIFWVGMTFYIGLLMATWSHMTELRAMGKVREVLRTLHLTAAGGFGGVVIFAVTILAFSKQISAFLFPQAGVAIEPLEVMLFALYIAFRVWSDTHSIALQAIGEAGVTIKFIPIQAAISIGLQIFLSRHIGMEGIVLGLIASHALTATWLLPLQLRRALFLKHPTGAV